MWRKIIKKRCWILVAAFVLAGVSPGWADFYVIPTPSGVGTRINSLPYTIDAPGLYYLGGDLTSAGSGITVNVDDVTIDLMGFSLIGPGSGYDIGIHLPGRVNVEIRNGTVRSFVAAGIQSTNAGRNNRVINVRLNQNGNGINLVGQNLLIQNCNASNNNFAGIATFGSFSMITGNVSCSNLGNGISATGNGHSLIGNVASGNGSHGFNLSYTALGAPYYYLIDRNNVSNNTAGNLNGSPPGSAWGINAGIGP
ncbi:MAG: hypothetical protein AB9866_03535 [Syntrophobacteraceae bacterium]